eukprot:GABV01007671.1.p1 GENE.GABV01007671.1~~GABV01007671.1.p1  ORF type:complete len:111 (-),score=43.31 GABV01007671.1:3-335(-)
MLVDWCVHLCRALEAIHAHNLIHRDLKPANIFLTENEEGKLIPKIGDFGISFTDAFISENERGGGTPGYMAPELARSKATQAGDVYSLGIVFLELFTLQFVNDPNNALDA